jgi:hypothetical protein
MFEVPVNWRTLSKVKPPKKKFIEMKKSEKNHLKIIQNSSIDEYGYLRIVSKDKRTYTPKKERSGDLVMQL